MNWHTGAKGTKTEGIIHGVSSMFICAGWALSYYMGWGAQTIARHPGKATVTITSAKVGTGVIAAKIGTGALIATAGPIALLGAIPILVGVGAVLVHKKLKNKKK